MQKITKAFVVNVLTAIQNAHNTHTHLQATFTALETMHAANITAHAQNTFVFLLCSIANVSKMELLTVQALVAQITLQYSVFNCAQADSIASALQSVLALSNNDVLVIYKNMQIQAAY